MLIPGDKAVASAAAAGESDLLFGPFWLSRSRKQLQHQGRPVPLGGRALELLLALAERAGQLVTRQELMALVWPKTVVEENSLRVHIAALRKALGEGSSDARYIANVPGRGYIFVMEVRRGSAPAAAQAEQAAARSPALIGRGEVVAQLAALLGERRMVSIVGPGGIGKTSVALAVARLLRPRFADGVCFVDLAALDSGEMLPSAVAAALGLAACSADVAGAVCRFAAARQVLIVLDNCEHVADAAALLAERLLFATGGVRLLATSREALYLHTESVHRLAPLAAPEPGAALSVEQALAYPALQLFSQRAMADASGFLLSEANLDSAIFLCHQLDGNPLAIELAAARVESLGVEGLASRLGNLFGLLTRGRRTAFPRHQTLHAMLDWSYRLLDDTERAVFNRLSVFRNAFCLDWAVQVCGCERIGAPAVIESVLSLGVKSLLSVETAGELPRYRLLHTTRLYGALRLEEAGEVNQVAARHARCMLAVNARADADLKVLPARQWRERYGATADDFNAALDWAFSSQGEPMVGIELTAMSWFVMLEMGRIDEHRQRVCRALDALAGQGAVDPQLHLRLLSAQVLIAAHSNGGSADAEHAVARVRALMRQVGQPALNLQVLHAICGWAFGQGNYPLVRDTAASVAEVAAQADDPVAVLLGERFMALCLHYLGEHREAGVLARRVLASSVTQRNVHLLGQVPRAVSMRALQARLLWIEGCPDQALALAHEALQHAEGQHPFAMCQALATSAIPIALWRGDNALAASLSERLAGIVNRYSLGYWLTWIGSFREVLDRRAGGMPGERWRTPDNPAELDLLGTLAEAMALDSTVARVRQGTVLWCAAEILRARGECLLRAARPGSKGEAEALFLQSIAHARAQRETAWELRTATSLARLWEGGEREQEGRTLLAEVVARFGEGFDTADLAGARELLLRAPSAVGRFAAMSDKRAKAPAHRA